MFYILVVAAIFGAEFFIKKYIEENKEMHKKEEILNGNIIIERYHNKGAMLNFMENNISAVKMITGVIIGVLLLIFATFLPKKGKCFLKLGLAMILGGALSNLYDRFVRGYVVDYFSFKFLKKVVFNISDICIFIGSIIMALLSLIKKD